MAAVALLPPSWEEDTDDSRAKIAAYCDGLALEDFRRQSSFGVGLWERCGLNMDLYLYGRTRNRPTGKYRVRKIQGAVSSNVAIQTATSPRIAITQRSTGKPTKWFFNQAAAPPDMFADMPNPDQPLMPEQVQLLQQIIQQEKARAAAIGQPPAISPDILVRVDDFTRRAALEEAVQSKFAAGNGLFYLRENVLYNNIFGYQFHLQSWDDINRRPKWRGIEPMCVHVDSTKTDVAEMAYIQVDEFVGKYEAMQMYHDNPAMQAIIEEKAQAGKPVIAGKVPYMVPSYWAANWFYREVIIIRTTWLRNQPYPLTQDEAIRGGHVKPVEVPDVASPVAQSVAGPEDAADIPGGDVSGAAGDSGIAAPLPPQPLTRTAHFKTGDDGQPDMTQEVAFPDGLADVAAHPDLVRYSIREIVQVAGRTVIDKESERVDFPFWHNVNVPIPTTPWGQGEPERLERIEEAYNNTITDIVIGGEYASTPAKITTKEVVKANPALASGAYTNPRALYTVDSSVWLQLGGDRGADLIQTLMPPPAPPDQWRREEMLSKIFEDSSDKTAANSGTAPAPNASGVMVEALQSAGRSVVNSKSQRTELMLVHSVRVLAADILTRMTPEQLAEDFPKYSLYIWKDLHAAMVEHYLWCDAEIEIASGGAQARQNRALMLTNMKAQGIEISQPEIMEAADLDADEQAEKDANYYRKKAQLMQLGQPVQPTAPDGKPVNGTTPNGQAKAPTGNRPPAVAPATVVQN